MGCGGCRLAVVIFWDSFVHTKDSGVINGSPMVKE
jgi:hypothetical protein